MPFISNNASTFENISVGTGQCVAFVQAASGAPNTASWKAGIKVRNNDVKEGTAIATFDPAGHYKSAATGNHAAIFISQDKTGIWVWDQWKNKKETQKVHRRYIRFRAGNGSPSNDGDAFSVIE